MIPSQLLKSNCMEGSIHIALAVAGFFPENTAGTEVYVLNLAKNLIKRNYKVSIISTCIDKQTYSYEYENVHVYKFQIDKYESIRKLSGFEKPSGIDEFAKILDKIKPDIIHFHTFNRALNSFHVKLAKQKGIITVFTSHLGSILCIKGNFLYHEKKMCNGKVSNFKCLECFIHNKHKSLELNFFYSALINYIIIPTHLVTFFPSLNIIRHKKEEIKSIKKYSDLVVSISKWMIPLYKKNKIKNIEYIAQGIDTEIFNLKDADKKIENKLQILFIGRIVVLKGIHLLLDALNALDGDKFCLTIIANTGNEPDYFAKIKEKLKSIKHLQYFENISQNEVSYILGQSNILCLPSRFEMSPLVILEAFAQKIPVIGSDYIAIKEMVKHNVNGLLFKNGDSQSLKIQILRLLNEPELLLQLKQNIVPVRTFYDVAIEHDKMYRGLTDIK
jgi:glycosyltransferase involved in cell wall biosynthesis